MAKFQELLLILMHLTSEQLAKKLKILNIKHNNSRKKKRKNMFVEDGAIATVTQYHKNYMLSSNVKIIHQYLPQKMEELVIYYL